MLFCVFVLFICFLLHFSRILKSWVTILKNSEGHFIRNLHKKNLDVTGMDFELEGYWQQSLHQLGKTDIFSKVGTVYVYLLSNFRFDNNPLIVVI